MPPVIQYRPEISTHDLDTSGSNHTLDQTHLTQKQKSIRPLFIYLQNVLKVKIKQEYDLPRLDLAKD